MAHDITIAADGSMEFAFAGNRNQIWHRGGTEMQDGASLRDWKRAARLDWEAVSAPVEYSLPDGSRIVDGDSKVILRNDSWKRSASWGRITCRTSRRRWSIFSRI